MYFSKFDCEDFYITLQWNRIYVFERKIVQTALCSVCAFMFGGSNGTTGTEVVTRYRVPMDVPGTYGNHKLRISSHVWRRDRFGKLIYSLQDWHLKSISSSCLPWRSYSLCKKYEIENWFSKYFCKYINAVIGYKFNTKKVRILLSVNVRSPDIYLLILAIYWIYEIVWSIPEWFL